jgi:hypothetical protein
MYIAGSRAPTDKVLMPIGVCERVANDVKCIRVPFERLDGGCDVFRSPNFRSYDRKAECVRCLLNFAHLQHGPAIANIAHDRQPPESGHNLVQQLQALAARIGLLE